MWHGPRSQEGCSPEQEMQEMDQPSGAVGHKEELGLFPE